jgi:bifunctional non-homologous end joining protein LigD
LNPAAQRRPLVRLSGPLWIHEIKHDGFRLLVRREGARVRCFTRGGYDWADRFPAIVAAARSIRADAFLLDGEAIVCGPDGRADFEALRSRRRDRDVILFAFDLIELQGADWRQRKLGERKMRLASLLARRPDAIQFAEHLDDDGALVFTHACRMGLEGIVSKRIDAPYRSGPSKVWLKSKNPASEAVRREREEDWRLSPAGARSHASAKNFGAVFYCSFNHLCHPTYQFMIRSGLRNVSFGDTFCPHELLTQ